MQVNSTVRTVFRIITWIRGFVSHVRSSFKPVKNVIKMDVSSVWMAGTSIEDVAKNAQILSGVRLIDVPIMMDAQRAL